MSDLKLAFRQLIKAPGFTVTALLMLALGIGVTTVTFSFVHAMVLRALPVVEPDRLIAIDEMNIAQGFTRGMSMSYVDFVDWRRDNQTLAVVALFEDATYTLASDQGEAEAVNGGLVTAGFFESSGVAPILGRTFRPEEESVNGPHVVVLSHRLWVSRFNADPAILNRTVRINGEVYGIIGVMPEDFRFPDNAQLWTPIALPVSESMRGNHSFSGVARLKPGVTVEQARLDLNAIAARLAADHPASNANVGAHVVPLVEQMTADLRRMVLTLFVAVGSVLLITCVNLASLLLARGAGREREMAVRAALGASRRRLARQLLVENLVLGLAGGALGVVAASWGLDILVRSIGDRMPFWVHVTLDGPVLAFAFGVSILATLCFGLAPAWQLSRIALNDSLKDGGRSGSSSRHGLMRFLVGAELTLAVVLLIGAGLMVKSFLRLQAVNPGFESEGVLAFDLTFPTAAYPDAAHQTEGQRRIVEKLQAIAGVDSAALVSNLPLSGSSWGRGFHIAGQPEPKPGETPVALNRVVSTDYFRVMRIPVKAGRGFTAQDTATSPRVAVVDETFVRKFFPHENPIGQRIHYGRTGSKDWMEIVGVTADVRHRDLQDTGSRAGLYVPATQNPAERSVFFVLRTSLNPSGLGTAVRQAVAEIDRGLAVDDLIPMSERVSQSIWRDRLVGRAFSLFALCALLLASLGVYGVTAFATNQRTREIGVRMALGAQPGDVLRLVLGGGLRLAFAALTLGVVGALALTQLLRSQLYEVDPRDPLIFSGVIVLLALVALIACWLPARRATRVDPVTALRAE
jgi:putative ABC transport system permease protein